jgi:6-phosphogluconate dehydrogenase
MDIGMIGLGKMGLNMALRLLRGGHRVVAFDLSAEAVRSAAAAGAIGARSLEELVVQLPAPRAVWVMVPAGEITGRTIDDLAAHLVAGDTLVDGGNSHYRDTVRRAAALRERGVSLVDAGTSGGIWGLAEGYSLMIGGDAPAVERLRPIFETLAPAADRGWGRVGPVGAGHFTKMVHNGVEYGLMQAYAEGFALLQRKVEFRLDLAQVAEIWRHGSVVRSWLLDLAAAALAENPNMEGIAPYVPDSGEGRWTVQEAVDLGCALPVITLALQNRFRSQDQDPFGDRLLAALRNRFGGHAVKAAK